MKLLNLFLVTSYLFWDNGFGVVEGSIAAEKDLSLSSSEKQALDKVSMESDCHFYLLNSIFV
jgi:hypothetical protein